MCLIEFTAVFLICWVPFFTCNIMDAICSKLRMDCQPGVTAFLLTTWLGYVNSFINPVIYTIFNMEFRKAFKRILVCADWALISSFHHCFAFCFRLLCFVLITFLLHFQILQPDDHPGTFHNLWIALVQKQVVGEKKLEGTYTFFKVMVSWQLRPRHFFFSIRFFLSKRLKKIWILLSLTLVYWKWCLLYLLTKLYLFVIRIKIEQLIDNIQNNQ